MKIVLFLVVPKITKISIDIQHVMSGAHRKANIERGFATISDRFEGLHDFLLKLLNVLC